jgi:hypothetical protein
MAQGIKTKESLVMFNYGRLKRKVRRYLYTLVFKIVPRTDFWSKEMWDAYWSINQTPTTHKAIMQYAEESSKWAVGTPHHRAAFGSGRDTAHIGLLCQEIVMLRENLKKARKQCKNT